MKGEIELYNISFLILKVELHFNPSNAGATFVRRARMQRVLKKHLNSCDVGIHWIALAEYSHMSMHMPGFQSFFCFFASFCIGQISHHQHEG